MEVQSEAAGLPLGVISEGPVVGSVVDDPGSVSGGVADSNQQHTDAEPGVPELTKTQKRNLRKKHKRLFYGVIAGVSGAGTKRLLSDGSTSSPAVGTPQKRPRRDCFPSSLTSAVTSIELAVVNSQTQQSSKVTAGVNGAGTEKPQSGGSTPSPAVWTAQEKPRRDSNFSGSSALAVKGVKLAVVKHNFPTAKLTHDESKLIQLAILERTDAIPVGQQLPEVLGSDFEKGALIVSCANTATEEWIRSCFEENKEVLGGEVLKVLSASDLPKPVKVAFKTRDVITKDHGIFLRRLSRLNPNLMSVEWRVLQVSAEEHSSRWIFEVDSGDAEAIRKADFKAYTGLDCGVFKILHDPSRRTPATVLEAAVPNEKSSSGPSSAIPFLK